MLDSIRVHITQQRENMEKQAQMKGKRTSYGKPTLRKHS